MCSALLPYHFAFPSLQFQQGESEVILFPATKSTGSSRLRRPSRCWRMGNLRFGRPVYIPYTIRLGLSRLGLGLSMPVVRRGSFYWCCCVSGKRRCRCGEGGSWPRFGASSFDVFAGFPAFAGGVGIRFFCSSGVSPATTTASSMCRVLLAAYLVRYALHFLVQPGWWLYSHLEKSGWSSPLVVASLLVDLESPAVLGASDLLRLGVGLPGRSSFQACIDCFDVPTAVKLEAATPGWLDLIVAGGNHD